MQAVPDVLYLVSREERTNAIGWLTAVNLNLYVTTVAYYQELTGTKNSRLSIDAVGLRTRQHKLQ
jgi:hypothetical protein